MKNVVHVVIDPEPDVEIRVAVHDRMNYFYMQQMTTVTVGLLEITAREDHIRMIAETILNKLNERKVVA